MDISHPAHRFRNHIKCLLVCLRLAGKLAGPRYSYRVGIVIRQSLNTAAGPTAHRNAVSSPLIFHSRLPAHAQRQLVAFAAARSVASSSGPSQPITSQGTPRENNPADPVTRSHIPSAFDKSSPSPASPVHPSLSTSQTVDAITRTTTKGGIGGAGVARPGGETGPGPNGSGANAGGAGPEPKIIIERVKRGRVRKWVVRFARGVLAIVLGGTTYILYCKPYSGDLSYWTLLRSPPSFIPEPTSARAATAGSDKEEPCHPRKWLGVNCHVESARHRRIQCGM